MFLLGGRSEAHFLEEAQFFWRQVYQELSRAEGIVYDTRFPAIVYEKIDLSHILEKERSQALEKRKLYWKKRLLDWHTQWLQGVPPLFLSSSEKALYQALQKTTILENRPFLRATHRRRLKARWGQKEVFLKALERARIYLPHVEQQIFELGLPREFACLPYVESYWSPLAKSVVSASGVWQLMPSVAKAWIRVDELLDERNDPFLATTAAGNLLKKNIQALHNQPVLALIAYNHGRKNLLRAVRHQGSVRVEDLFLNYKSRSFGPDGRHFYPQFLITHALDEEDRKSTVRSKAPLFREWHSDHSLFVFELEKKTGCSAIVLKQWNNHWREPIWSGIEKIPKKYPIHLPVFDCSQSQTVPQIRK